MLSVIFRLPALFFFILLTLLSLPACKQQEADHTQHTNDKTQPSHSVAPAKPVHNNNTAWLEHISAHSKGKLSQYASIRIQFNHDIVSADKVGQTASNLRTTPKISGKTTFASTSEIVLIPENPLPSGKQYEVKLRAQGLADMPAELSDYSFSFSIIPLDYEIRTKALITNGEEAELPGELLTSDRVQAEAVKKIIQARHQDQPLKVNWTHSEDGTQHRFSVPAIKRETFASDLTLTWNAQSIGLEDSGKTEVPIPPVGAFQIDDVEVVHRESSHPYITISFTDNLDTEQNLAGLIELIDQYDNTLKADRYKLRIDNNQLYIYPVENLVNTHTLRLHPGIKSEKAVKLTEKSEHKAAFQHLKPQLKFSGSGHILPDNQRLEIPFEGVAINAVQVTAFEIFPDNMGQFLQNNTIAGTDGLERVGRYLWRKTIALNPANPNQWNRFSFDATALMKKHSGSLIRLSLSIDRRHSAYHCSEDTKASTRKDQPLMNYEDDDVTEVSGWDGIENYEGNNQSSNSSWETRNDPCADYYYEYYNEKTTAERNFVASNLGVLAKQDVHNHLRVVVTDLRTAEPVANAQLEIRNFQGQTIATTQTSAEGFAAIQLNTTPFLLIARKNKDTTYLKINAKTALSVSHFDVGGETVENGLKAAIYGERGVWRPGDDIYLTFVLQDRKNKIPAEHPVTMKLFDPSGREMDSQVNKQAVGNFYTFKLSTEEKSPTGKWLAKAYLGGNTFSKSLLIETVRPNRLKVELDFENTEVLHGYQDLPKATLFGQWLHGASAADLKADISVRFREKTTSFGRFNDYAFDDPARKLDSEDKLLLEGRLDKQGYLNFQKNFVPEQETPGMLSAWFTNRVFEQGGNFSISKQYMDYHPFKHYVGLKTPKGDAARNMLLTDTEHTVDIASVDAQGEPVALEQVQVTLYKVEWKWWWDKSPDSLAAYTDANHSSKLQQDIIQTIDGRGQWKFSIKYPEWGRYLIRACDLEGKHCTGKTVYIDWPGWAGRAQEEGGGAASMLNLFSDKKEYQVGETAIIQLPKATQGRALVTVETGGEILSYRWQELTPERSQLSLPITRKMAPNAYFSVTLLQAHADKDNDRPIRLYGIIPLKVVDLETHLHPVLKMKDEWKPESTQSFAVTEANGKSMTYTVAMVDEGLLGLTRFKVPELHTIFYQKEKLGIKTWDMFDDVVGAYGGQLERLLALGGGDNALLDDESSRHRRFPPVVKFMGPFTLAAGKANEHSIELPPYLGAVRVMLVAADKDAYGQAEKSVFVRQPLMLQASMPRVLTVDEEVTVPVTLFATDDTVKTVVLSVETNPALDIIGEAKTTIHFNQPGEKLGLLRLKAGTQAGKGQIRFKAVSGSGSHHSDAEINLDIRNANTPTTRVSTKAIDPGLSWETQITPHGMAGTQQATLELSNIPSLNLEKHLGYLVRYPHGCLEQVTSAAFPQLYLSRLLTLTPEQQKDSEHHIRRAIDHMRQYQQGNGNFSYWPGMQDENQWASLYAGHFLLEAQKQGYQIPTALLHDWLQYQKQSAQRWISGNSESMQTQAYRLYVLSVAGSAELGAMNRLREATLDDSSRWFLAAAYQQASQLEAAQQLLQGVIAEVPPSKAMDDYDVDASSHFGSRLSALGQQLETLLALNRSQDARLFVDQIAEELNRENTYHHTHGIAWALLAVSRYVSGQPLNLKAQYSLDGVSDESATVDVQSEMPLVQQTLPVLPSDGAKLNVQNTGDKPLYVSVLSHGIPQAGEEQAATSGLKLHVNYYDSKRPEKEQHLDFAKNPQVEQGHDIEIEVTVINTRKHKIENIALDLPITSAWELHNSRYQPKDVETPVNAEVDYEDVRDDRIYKYFDLEAGEEKEFRILVNAAYMGRYYLPAARVTAMYDERLQARVPGHWLTIVNSKTEQQATKDAQVSGEGEHVDSETSEAGDKAVKLPYNSQVIVKKAWLYDEPDMKTKNGMYLIKEDTVSVLKLDDDWAFIRFKGKKVVEKWLQLEVLKTAESSE